MEDEIMTASAAVTASGKDVPTRTTQTTVEPKSTTIEPLTIGDEVDVEEQNASPRTKLRIYSILASLYLVLFIAALDQTIVATSIPTITAEFHSASGYTWIGAAYLLANAAASPIWSRCSDIWGRKKTLLIAIALFATGSTIAAVSGNMRTLIAARAVQGTAGGGTMQMVSITISDLFSVRDRALQFGLMGFVWALAGSAGPLLGGALTEYAGWRWLFWINLPVCVAAFVLVVACLNVHNPRTPFRKGIRAVDWYGTVSILAVTLLLLLGLNFGGVTFAWKSPVVICLVVVGGLMIGVFLYSEDRLAKYPLMPLGVFESWSNNALFLLSFGHNMVSLGVEFYLPLYFQSVKQASPLRSGILLLPMVLTEAATDILVGFFIKRTGRFREVVWTGVSLMTLGTGLYISLGPETTVAKIAGFEIVWGLGTAMLFQAPMIAVQNTVAQSETAAVNSTMGFINKMATSFSIVLGGVIFQNSIDARHAALASSGLDERVLDKLSGSTAAANVGVLQTIDDPTQRQIVLDAFAGSIRNIFIFYTCAAALALIASAFVKHQSLRTEHTETKTGVENMKQRDSNKT